MATRVYSRTFLSRPTTAKSLISSLFSRSFSSSSISVKPSSVSSLLNRLRPLTASNFVRLAGPLVRGFATRAASSSLNDPNPNWSNRPPKETILLDGCDFKHWLVVMEPPEGNATRDEIIDSYIKTLAMVIGSEEEARMKIYSVSTRCYYAFGALVDEELSYKIKELPRVRWVLPDSYLDVKNKDYGGEPFINGQAVPYDPKYHEEWIRNNNRANERNRRNDRPRNFDRSRNFERRRENMQNRDFQNQGMQNPASNMSGMPPNNIPPSNMPPNNMPPNNMAPNMGRMPPNMGGMPQNNMGGMAQNNMGGMPQHNMGGVPQHMGGEPQHNMGGMPAPNNYGEMLPPPNNYGGTPPPPNNYGGTPPSPNYGGPTNNYGGMPPTNNYGGMPPTNTYGGVPVNNNTSNMGGMPPNTGWSGNMSGNMQHSGDAYQNAMPNSVPKVASAKQLK